MNVLEQGVYALARFRDFSPKIILIYLAVRCQMVLHLQFFIYKLCIVTVVIHWHTKRNSDLKL